MREKIVICAALTGSITSKANNLNLPINEDEIIQAAIMANRAGAAMVHIHVREHDGSPSLSYSKYQYVIKKIRELCNVIICISTSNYGIEISDQERYKLYDLDADVFSLAFGSLDRPNGKIVNTSTFISNSLEIIESLKKKAEIELFNTTMIESFHDYVCSHNIRHPYLQYIFGSPGGMRATYSNISTVIENISDNCLWSAVGVGKMQLPANIMSMTAGAKILRTGLEDNVYLERGIKASSNSQLVSRLVNLIDLCGYDIADLNDARNIIFS